MRAEAREQLRRLIQGFLDGNDQSKSYVHRIEDLLLDAFLGTDLYEELTTYLAMYQPGGGEHLYNQLELASEFRYVLKRFFDDISGT